MEGHAPSCPKIWAPTARRPPLIKMAKRSRLDTSLVARGLFQSREQAQRAIMAGQVKIGTRVASKPSELLETDAEIEIAEWPKYVGRGGVKLERALDFFG